LRETTTIISFSNAAPPTRTLHAGRSTVLPGQHHDEHSSVVTHAMDNSQELARAENQLRAMLSPDTPAPSSSEVRTMRKKIAELKNPAKRPSGADMRQELEKLQRQNTALLQLKELEIENLKLKGMSVADIKKKEDEMVALKAKQVELQRVVSMAGGNQTAARGPPVAVPANMIDPAVQAQVQADALTRQAEAAMAQMNAQAAAAALEADAAAAQAAAVDTEAAAANAAAHAKAQALANAAAAAANAEAAAAAAELAAAQAEAQAVARARAEAEAAANAKQAAERKAVQATAAAKVATEFASEDEAEAARLVQAMTGAVDERELVSANVGAGAQEMTAEERYEAEQLAFSEVGSVESHRMKEAEERAKSAAAAEIAAVEAAARQVQASTKADAEATAAMAAEAARNAGAIGTAEGEYMGRAEVAAKAEADATAAADTKAKAIAEAKTKALGAAKAELARLQVVNRLEIESKTRARAPVSQTLLLGAEAKAKAAADSIAIAQAATEMAAASEACAIAERLALESAVAVIKTIETAEEKAIVSRTTANHAAEAKIALDLFAATDKEGFAHIAQEATNAKYEADMAASEKAQADKGAAEKAAADRAVSAQAAAEKAAVDKGVAEAAAQKAISEDAEAKAAAAEEAAAAKAAAEEAAAISKAEAEAAAEKKAKEDAEAAEKAARAAKLEKLKAKAKEDPEGAYYEIEKMVRAGEGNTEDWTEAKRQADEVVGHLLGVVKKGVTPTPGDVWMIEPMIPVAGSKLTVYYNAAATCLAGVKQYGSVTCNSGCNNWEQPEKTVMKEVKARFKVNGKPIKAVKGSWWQKAEIDVPEEAFVVDIVFSDGGSQYDNNNRADFHAAVEGAEESLEINRWGRASDLYYQLVDDRVIREEKAKIRNDRRAILRKKSKGIADEVTRRQREHVLYVDPPDPRAGQTVRVHYNPSNTNLKTANEVYIIGGWNRWTHAETIGPIKMEPNEAGGQHVSCEFTVPADAYKMDFVFASKPNGKGLFDNNNRLDYHVPIKGGMNATTGEPVKEPPLHIVSISVEMAPIAKVGGLGDVVTSLARATKEEGHKVEVVLPKYDILDYDSIEGFVEVTGFSWGMTYNRVWHGLVEGVDTYFIDPENGMFQVGMIYGTDYLEIPLTDAERFGFFSRAALEWMLQSKRNPDIIHCHDWQTAPCAKSYWEDYNAYGLDNPRIVFTIHNLNYGKELIKEAMTYSQASTTVSRTYREEIATHGSIVDNLPKFHGVVNGIDPDIWDPSGDDFLPRYYDETEVVAGKAAARQALCAYSNIPNKEGTPLVGIVTRLTSQKGVHMIRHGIKRALERGCQVILLGSAPDPEIQQDFDMMFHELKNGYHDYMCFHLYYNEPLSHLVYAGSDIILVPSMFEPCGLSQLIAMRYGTVPVVRRTGGLNDTVFDYDVDHGKAEWEGMKPNGFSFDGTEDSAIDFALDRAISLAYDKPSEFRALQANCMTQDWSWNRPALEYIEIYHAARKPY
jgi:starch synthase